MKHRSYLGILIVISVVLSSCNVGPEPIDYGADGCHFCSMTIVDKQHASQFVTQKGKVFKFDAVECMMNHLKEVDKGEVALFFVSDYTAPGVMIDATKATYLVSKDISSPMGEFLTAFGSIEVAEKAQEVHEGQLLTWEELQVKFRKH